MPHPDFMKKYTDELKKVHPDWPHKQAFGEAAALWSTYKTSGVLPDLVHTISPIEPTPTPLPPITIQFSKNPSENILTITEGSIVLHQLHYVGQAHLWENTLKQVLDAVGVARFKEYVNQLVLLNTNFLR
jgi:hypothetical protein